MSLMNQGGPTPFMVSYSPARKSRQSLWTSNPNNLSWELYLNLRLNTPISSLNLGVFMAKVNYMYINILIILFIASAQLGAL